MTTRTISQLAKALGVNVETIRFYERRGLVNKPPKPEVGYRHYPDRLSLNQKSPAQYAGIKK